MEERGEQLIEQAHPSTPWEVTPEHAMDRDDITTTVKCGAHGETIRIAEQRWRKGATAAHVVRCVNAHEKLREALVGLVAAVDEWNTAVEKIIGRFPHSAMMRGEPNPLEKARAALAAEEEPDESGRRQS